MGSTLTYLQAIVLGLVQGVTELFPVSSLGHSVLLPAWIGGSWQSMVTQGNGNTTPYLAFIVALHVATAIALLLFFWRDWVRIVGAFLSTLRTRRITTSAERLAWLIIVATIPVGLLGLLLEKELRHLFAKPLAASIFLTINGLVLIAAERLRSRTAGGDRRTGPMVVHAAETGTPGPEAPGRAVFSLSMREAFGIGLFQATALLAGISRSGVTMVGGLVRGLDHEDAARFAFLLATPVILAAGMLKLPELLGPTGRPILGQAVVGAAVAFVCALASVAFLIRWFRTRTLYPFAAYCLVVGVASILRFA